MRAYTKREINVCLGSGSEIRSLTGTSDVPVQSGSSPPVWSVPVSDLF
jgi:hypothetical protein